MTSPPGGASPTLGIVTAGHSATSFMFRGVGPSLKAFGIANPAAEPVLHYYDAAGVEFGFVYAVTDAFSGIPWIN